MYPIVLPGIGSAPNTFKLPRSNFDIPTMHFSNVVFLILQKFEKISGFATRFESFKTNPDKLSPYPLPLPPSNP